jgi:hypothetical protein
VIFFQGRLLRVFPRFEPETVSPLLGAHARDLLFIDPRAQLLGRAIRRISLRMQLNHKDGFDFPAKWSCT